MVYFAGTVIVTAVNYLNKVLSLLLQLLLTIVIEQLCLDFRFIIIHEIHSKQKHYSLELALIDFTLFGHWKHNRGLFVLFQVHALYRNTGASFEKAQSEFATTVMQNKNVQSAATTVITESARQAMNQQAGSYGGKF